MNLQGTLVLGYFILLIVGLLVNFIGYKKYLYFGSVGYSLSISTFGILMLIMYGKYMSISVLFSCVLLVIYGGRSSALLLMKEKNNSSYNRFINEKTKGNDTVDGVTKYITWLFLTIMYTFQVSPIFYRISNYASVIKALNMSFKKTNDMMSIIGILIMMIGLFIINFSDIILARNGKKKKKRLNNTGFFEYLRGGNYIGDLIFWTGVFVSGFKAMVGTLQKVIAIIGYVFILFFIFGGAKRIFKK